MLYQELKRRFFTKYVLFSIIGILLLSIVLNIIPLVGDHNIHERLKEESVYSGEMTEDKLWLGLKMVRDKQSDEIKYKTLVNFISGLVYNYPNVLYHESRVKDFPDSYAKDFYQLWRKKSIKIIEKTTPQDYQAKALQELDKVKIPFIKYEGSYFWNLGISNLANIYLIIIFMVTFFAAATYSDSFEDRSMEIIHATKLGKKMMIIRILPVIMYGLVLTLVATLVTILIFGLVTGLQTLKSSLKVFLLFSIGNFTLGSGILLMFISELLGVMALSSIMGWISYKTLKTSLSISIGVSMNILYIILTFLIKLPWRFLKVVLNMFPIASSQIINDIAGYKFNLFLWSPYSVMVSMIIIFVVFAILLKRAIYREKI